MAFSAVLEIGDNDAKRYYKQYLLTDLRIVVNRSYTVIPEGWHVVNVWSQAISPKALIDWMTQAVHDFVGDTEQSDDLTMLVIRVKNPFEEGGRLKVETGYLCTLSHRYPCQEFRLRKLGL